MDKVRAHINLPDPGPTGAGVRVAVLDTGIDDGHADLAGAVDLAASRSTAMLSADDIIDRCGHGTHIASIVAGRGTRSSGRYRGIAPAAQLVVYKISSNGRGFEPDAVAAVEAAIDAGVDIINYSQGYSPAHRGKPPWVWPTAPSLIEQAFLEASSHGILCIAAIGNDGPSLASINRPAGLEEVLAIGAVDPQNAVAENSSRGPYVQMESLRIGGERRWDEVLDRNVTRRKKPDLVAPGEHVIAARAKHGQAIQHYQLIDPSDPDCPYVRWSGTSMATAVVSGVAACLIQLARDNGVDLGRDRAATLRTLLRLGTLKLAKADERDVGRGLVNWAVLSATLNDFATDEVFRRTVLEGPGVSLLP